MSDDILRLIGPIASRQARFDPGTALFRIGDPVRLVHFVRSGTVHLLRHQQNGAPLVLQRAGAGSILAEASLFSDRYHCDAMAVGAVETLCIPRPELRDRIAAGGDFAQAWARHLGREVQKARLQAEIMAIRTVSGRLDAWLAWQGTLPSKGEWIALAAEIGVTPEALYRELAKRRM